MLSRFTLAASILCLLALLSGCGSSAPATETRADEGTPSLARFVAEANRLCQRIQRRYEPEKDRYLADLEAASTLRDLKRLGPQLRRLGDKLEENAARLGAIEAPQEERRLFEAMVAAKASQGPLLRSEASAFETLSRARARAAAAAVAAKQRSYTQLAETIGLEECGAES